MDGLSDIPIVGIVKDTIDASVSGLQNLLFHKANVKKLNDEIEKLSAQDGDVARRVAAERNEGKIIENHILEWQEEVEDIKACADELLRQRRSWNFFNVVKFLDPVSRSRLGAKAAHLADNVVELTTSGENILDNDIAYLPSNGDATEDDTTYEKFGSREEPAYRKLWEALVKEDGHPVIGIYGMPGVGKTMMIEQAYKQANEEMIFDNFTRANVGTEIDVIQLQEDLAYGLDEYLYSYRRARRASQLKDIINKKTKTLVLLDDVWDFIPLNNIGIPVGNGSFNHCKILLTSRSRKVCLDYDCKDPIEIKPLTVDEAWNMFQNTVGHSKIKSLNDASLAKKICNECAALPLLIHEVAKALMSVSENSWKDALHELENGRFQEIDGRTAQVYTCLLKSFDKLGDAAKKSLLLCSLFPQDADIEIKMLFDLATGSQLLDKGTNIYELIDILKSSSMLLHGKDDYSVKIHDIIRDVARSVAARDPEYAFLYARCKSWLPDIADYSTRRLLHLDLEGENVCFPNDLLCPDLHTLWLQCNSIHSQKHLGGFFKAFKNLRFLLLKGMSSSKQQLSIGAMEKLSVLILDGCDVDETFLTSIPKNIETLRIWECNIPTPLHLPKLEKLKKFELLVGLKK